MLVSNSLELGSNSGILVMHPKAYPKSILWLIKIVLLYSTVPPISNVLCVLHMVKESGNKMSNLDGDHNVQDRNEITLKSKHIYLESHIILYADVTQQSTNEARFCTHSIVI